MRSSHRILVLAAFAGSAPVWLPCAFAQTAPAVEGQTPVQQITSASAQPDPVTPADPRLDSGPHDTVVREVPPTPSTPVHARYFMGPPAVPATPAGMIGKPEPGNPAMVYYALPHRTGSDLNPADRMLLDGRQADLLKAAAYHGYDLKQSGWLYQQTLCPAMQPDAEQRTGVPASYDGQGALLLHFVREVDGRRSSFTAIVPRDGDALVRVISIAHNGVVRNDEVLHRKTTGEVANRAIEPAALYASLQPERDWLAATACLGELAGAYPHMPSNPGLDDATAFAPTPRLEVEQDGSRDVRWTDRIDNRHLFIWTVHVSKTGHVESGTRENAKITPLAVTRPPLPKVHVVSEPPEPRVEIRPAPPPPPGTQAE